MDRMMEQLNQILNDPERMKQISEVVSAMGDVPFVNEQAQINIPPAITQMIGQVQKKDEKQQALVQALLPYLHPSHQTRLERAMQVAKLSKLAGVALRTQTSAIHEENAHDV